MKPATLPVAVLITLAVPAAVASTASEREYQRGYNDCSQGRYDQDQHGESYKQGCRAAEDGQQPSRPAGNSGAKARISDLKGMDSIKAFDVMTSRGFTGADTITSGDTLYSIYYNAETRQCVQLTNANGRVASADDIGSHPNCR
jgi:hypothetical protein